MKDRLLFLWQHPLHPCSHGWESRLVFFLYCSSSMTSVWKCSSEPRALEKEWAVTRQALMYHREARKAKQDLSRVWAVLPAERDFTPLALGISDAAKRDRVTLPGLSYKTEPTLIANTSKGLLQGPMTGRYEDLRRFIYGLETAEELVFIEDLELARSGGLQDASLTFNIKIATYLRGDTGESSSSGPTH